jgi:hypothetical protein
LLPRGTSDFREVCAQFGGRLRSALSSPNLTSLVEEAPAKAAPPPLPPAAAPRRSFFACFAKPVVAEAPASPVAAPAYTPASSLRSGRGNRSNSLRGGSERSLRNGVPRDPSVRGCKRATLLEVGGRGGTAQIGWCGQQRSACRTCAAWPGLLRCQLMPHIPDGPSPLLPDTVLSLSTHIDRSSRTWTPPTGCLPTLPALPACPSTCSEVSRCWNAVVPAPSAAWAAPSRPAQCLTVDWAWRWPAAVPWPLKTTLRWRGLPSAHSRRSGKWRSLASWRIWSLHTGARGLIKNHQGKACVR